ncbi:MAG: hypothetical protein GX455_14070 [Phycisphaerae bacterium]|nr:hypothetical protein [Phycisphaerae bacterium]
MEMTWKMRFRIAGAMLAGIVLLGILTGPVIRPADPESAITLYQAGIKPMAIASCFAMAFVSGLLAFFIAWPFGRELAVLAAPAGLAYWACSSGNMFSLIILNSGFAERKTLYSAMKWEGFFWLAVVACGWLGSIVAARLSKAKPIAIPGIPQEKPGSVNLLNIVSGLAVSVVIANFVLIALAQDVRIFDSKLGSVIGQPGTAQIAFAVLVAFGLAAYCSKYFLDIGHIYTVIAAAVLLFLVFSWYSGNTAKMQYMSESKANAFFPNAICAILPLQILAFAPIGAVAGYWLAVKTHYHRQNPS